MNVPEAIKNICAQVLPDWEFRFNDRQSMNVEADDILFPFVFFEEYREGNYRCKHFFDKTTKCELYFCKRLATDEGDRREALRDEIEVEAVVPFIKAFNDSGIFQKVVEWKFFAAPPRFDAAEVSIMLQFDAVTTSC